MIPSRRWSRTPSFSHSSHSLCCCKLSDLISCLPALARALTQQILDEGRLSCAIVKMKKKKIKAIARAAHAAAKSGKPVQAEKPARAGKSKEERRLRKMEQRRREKAKITPSQWAAPAPSHLVGKREVPKVKSKYQSYFEFTENTEKKKKLEFRASICFIVSGCVLISPQVTNDTNPPPGFAFVPIGDPQMTNMCKDLSRTRDAMIFIVSVRLFTLPPSMT